MEQRISDKLICLAAVATAHGVKGALKLRCFTADPTSVASYGPLLDAEGRELFAIEIVGPTKGGVIVRADGVTDRNQAEALRGLELFVPRSRLPDTDEDEYYLEDLVGLTALDDTEAPIGRIKAVLDHGSALVLEIERAGDDVLSVPFTEQHVPVVDIAAGRVVLRVPQEIIAAETAA